VSSPARSSSKRLGVIAAIDSTHKVLLNAQLSAARDAGYEVHTICSPGPNRDWLIAQGYQVHTIEIKRKLSPLSDLQALMQLYRLIRQQRFDIIHTHTPKVSLLGQMAARLAGVPVIVNTIHGFYFHEHMRPLARRFYIAMEWMAARCSTTILSQNPEDIETAIKLGIARRENIHFLGNGVNLDKFDPDRFDADQRAAKRAEIGIPQDALVVGIIGRLVEEKGFLELFEAMQGNMADHPNVWLVIIGSEEPDKPDRISNDTFVRYGIAERTRWLGSREDIPDLLACFDVYALPSWREGFPRSAIEAACMRLPIVTTDIRGCRQVVTHEHNGLLVPLRDKAALEASLRRLIDEPELRSRFGQAGYERSRVEFDEQRICWTVLETYARCIELRR
jgi:glycosyltransferase involved in cell wall biosynthesis